MTVSTKPFSHPKGADGFKKIIGADKTGIYLLFCGNSGLNYLAEKPFHYFLVKYSNGTYGEIFSKEIDITPETKKSNYLLETWLIKNKIILLTYSKPKDEENYFSVMASVLDTTGSVVQAPKEIMKTESKKDNIYYSYDGIRQGRYTAANNTWKYPGVWFFNAFSMNVTLASDSSSFIAWCIHTEKDHKNPVLQIKAFDLSLNPLYENTIHLPFEKSDFTIGNSLYNSSGFFLAAYVAKPEENGDVKKKSVGRYATKIISVFNSGKDYKIYNLNLGEKEFAETNFYADGKDHLLACTIYAESIVGRAFNILFQKINTANKNIEQEKYTLLDSSFIQKFIDGSKKKEMEIFVFEMNYLVPDGKDGYYMTAEQLPASVSTVYYKSSFTTSAPTAGAMWYPFDNIFFVHFNKDGSIVSKSAIPKRQDMGSYQNYEFGSYYFFTDSKNSPCFVYNDAKSNVQYQDNLNDEPIDYGKYHTLEYPLGAIGTLTFAKIDQAGKLFRYAVKEPNGKFDNTMIFPKSSYKISSNEVVLYSQFGTMGKKFFFRKIKVE